MQKEQSNRIQTSILNSAEKKALVWLAKRLPSWVTSNMLTFIGSLGALIIAAGYILANLNINFLWLASFGFLVNWYGDSLDGTLARVRNTQRPIYGFFVDHMIDCFNEVFMFIGVGLSPLIDFNLALIILALYLILSVYVYINAHLKGEFKLTYAKMGPTEFRVIAIIVNTLFIYITSLREFTTSLKIFGNSYTLTLFDIVAIFIIGILTLIIAISFIHDTKEYAKIDPPKKYGQN